MIKKFRDISIININDSVLSIACDSSAGIGSLENDIVQSDGHTVGYYSAFVPLIETISVGAKPTLIINTLSVSNDDYGQSIIGGIKAAAKDACLCNENCITGSTEDNFAIAFTSLGVTVIGNFTNKKLPSFIDNAHELYLIGLPKVGSEVLKDRHMILTVESALILKSKPQIIDMLPVGSKGILYELNEMANTLNADIILDDSVNIDLKKSTGPATCAIVAVKKGYSDTFEKVNIPINRLGEIIPR